MDCGQPPALWMCERAANGFQTFYHSRCDNHGELDVHPRAPTRINSELRLRTSGIPILHLQLTTHSSVLVGNFRIGSAACRLRSNTTKILPRRPLRESIRPVNLASWKRATVKKFTFTATACLAPQRLVCRSVHV